MIIAPINVPMPSADPNNPPRVGVTFKTSVAMTGMKYCNGSTMPFITRDIESTPSTNLLEKECPIPDLIPCQNTVSRTNMVGTAGSRILKISSAATRSRITSTANTAVNP